jgi:GNAT superfamily N-acetyltransferase
MIEYRDTHEGIDRSLLDGFFVGWKRPHTPEEHLRILRKSDHVVLALDTTENRVVGYITALTDHEQAAFIPLLEVLPGYQRQGIGSELVSRMLEKLRGIPAIDLTCDRELQRFYARFGMQPSTGMIIRDY